MARKAKQPAAPVWRPDTTTACESHRLVGLEPDNLLAFMALLGLLRALEYAKPEWLPRAYWDVDTLPLRPILTLAHAATQAEVAEAAAKGAGLALSPVRELCGKSVRLEGNRSGKEKSVERITDIAKTAEELKELHGTQDRLREAWVSCLAGCARTREGDLAAQSSPLKLTSGQQAFAGLFAAFATSAKDEEVARTLFQPWQYLHRGDSFRLDRLEARRYAYLAGDPTDKALWTVEGQTGKGIAPSERGANLLAAVGYLSFPVFTARRGVSVPGSEERGTRRIRVPLWSRKKGRGATLAGISKLFFLAGRDEPFRHPDVLGWQSFVIFEVSDNPSSKYKSVAYEDFISADEMDSQPPV